MSFNQRQFTGCNVKGFSFGSKETSFIPSSPQCCKPTQSDLVCSICNSKSCQKWKGRMSLTPRNWTKESGLKILTQNVSGTPWCLDDSWGTHFFLRETTIRPIHVYPRGTVWYTQPTLQRWHCASVHVCVCAKGKHIASHVDTFKNIHGKSSYSGDAQCFGHFKNIHLHMHKQWKIQTHIQTTHIKYLRVFPGAYASIQTKADKRVICLGPSHEWSNRSISCMMAVRSRPDRLSLSDFTLLSCLSVIPAGTCGLVDMVVGFCLWGCIFASGETHLGFWLMYECIFESSMHYSWWFTEPLPLKLVFTYN